MENIDELKVNTDGHPRYVLRSGNLFVSYSGLHYLDYLDPVDEISPEIDGSQLTPEIAAYVEGELQSNVERLERQLATVATKIGDDGRLLDIGCGGGVFLARVAATGAEVLGIELSDSRAEYAQTRHQLKIVKRPIESTYWSETYARYFDAVTLWDVIEHVNFPRSTLLSAATVLRSAGLIFIETPCRDSFYHRFGELSYKLSRGRYPTFLNTMYSSELFGHKQIFSTGEMQSLLEDAGFDVLSMEKLHELSFPYRFYLKKMLRSDLLVRIAVPIVSAFLWLFPVRNKMVAIGRKR